MRVLLVNPSQLKVYGNIRPPVQMHMGLAYLGTVLKKQGYPISIVDMDAEHLTAGDLRNIIRDDFIDLVGITVTTPALNTSLSLVAIIKELSPNTKTVFGGMHPSVMPKETIGHNNVDFVIKGEGEITLLELVKAIELKSEFKDIKGLIYKEKGTIIENSDRELITDLDSLPFPSRELFKNRSYTYPDSLYAQTAPMITSRGCPGKCTYCNAHSIFGRSFRARTAKNVVDEVEYLKNKFGIREIHIWDDNFATKKDRVYQIKDEIKNRNIKIKFAFPNGIRADFLDKNILLALKEMGTYSIAVGVESGSQDVLNRAKKGVRLNKVIEVFSNAKKIGLETWAFFMFGLPGETQDSIRQTISFSKKLDPDIAKFHILKPYPGTEAYNFIFDNQLLSSSDFDNFGIHTPPVHHFEGLSETDMLKFQKKAYREFYFRPVKMIKQILRIKSLNRLKLNLNSALDITKVIFNS